jgi:plasmid maintenance system antidote protein VapI
MEQYFDPDWACPPGWILQELREERRISLHDFAGETGLTVAEVKELDEGHFPIDPLLAERLEYVTGIPEHFWLTAESNFRKDLEMGKKVYGTWK